MMSAFDPKRTFSTALLHSNTGWKSAEYVRAPTDCHFLIAISLLRGTAMKMATAIAALGCIPEPMNGMALSNYQAKIDWFGTVRGRLGLLVSDQLLIYGTGGLAYGRVAVSGGTNVSAQITDLSNPALCCFFAPATAAFSASKTNVGFAVGAGIEGRLFWLPANWTWKVEYLYLDLGSVDTTSSFVLPSLSSATVFSPITGTINTHTHFTDNIVRVGLNYQFH
jgi:outer membrane immunogenic protein